MFVDVLGSKAMTSVPLGILDVCVAKGVRPEPLRAALVGAGDRTLAGVQHHVGSQVGLGRRLGRAARVGAGKSRWRRCVLASGVPLEMMIKGKGGATTVSLAGEWPQLQMDLFHVASQINFLGEGEATGDALKRALLEVNIA